MLRATRVAEIPTVVESSSAVLVSVAVSEVSSFVAGAPEVVHGCGVTIGGVSMSPANAGQQSTSNRTNALRNFRITLFLFGIIRWTDGRPRARGSRLSGPANFLQGLRRAYLT